MADVYLSHENESGKEDIVRTNIQVEGDVDIIVDEDTGEAHERTVLDDADTAEVIASIQN